jgi:predicted enzyme related to lactoylglutathione lyase
MHRSRIGGIFIDHPASSFAASLAFWAAAMGVEPETVTDEGYPYRSLGRFGGETLVELQRVGEGTTPRVHLDIDTDDVEAEVTRLESLGARRLAVGDNGRYWQMVDPGGIVFCVIPPHTPDFAEQAQVWD